MTTDHAARVKGCSSEAIRKAVRRGVLDAVTVLPDLIAVVVNAKFEKYTPREYPRKRR